MRLTSWSGKFHGQIPQRCMLSTVSAYDEAGSGEPNCSHGIDYIVLWNADEHTCPHCGNAPISLMCAHHTHLVMERYSSHIKSVLPADLETLAPYLHGHDAGELAEGPEIHISEPDEELNEDELGELLEDIEKYLHDHA